MPNKRKLLLLIVLFFSISTYFTTTKAQEVDFHNGSWEEIKALAKKENKPIFIDFYTDWCGWCKVMDKKTFKDPKVAEIANKNFIPYRLNAEKGEGIQIARQYKVRAFPTIIFYSPDGEVLGKLVGYTDSENFIEAMEFYLKKWDKKSSKKSSSSYNQLKEALEQYAYCFHEVKKNHQIRF